MRRRGTPNSTPEQIKAGMDDSEGTLDDIRATTEEVERQPLTKNSFTASTPSSRNTTSSWQKQRKQQKQQLNQALLCCLALAVMIGSSVWYWRATILQTIGGARSYLAGSMKNNAATPKGQLQIATWNIAAINNNPFEYWITTDENPHYEKLMIDVEKFIENPGDLDVPVSQVFTPDMFAALDKRLTGKGWKSMEEYWKNDFAPRKIVSGFLKDGLLGSKRLASMPDRVTNAINTANGQGTVFRPTVISMYEQDLSTQNIWWDAWSKFMFDTPITIATKEGGTEDKTPSAMLKTIQRSKYPKITAEEEIDSLPLQTLCGAIFDGILVHMMNTVSKPDEWQPLKRKMVDALNKQKVPHTLQILESTYADSDIITLQEVSSSLVKEAAQGALGRKFHVIAPANYDPTRDQNSVILLSKATFPDGKLQEITGKVEDEFPKDKDKPTTAGDLVAITTKTRDNVPLVVASFHGDTNGLATKPVLDAVISAMQRDAQLAHHQLIFGMDANTYEHAKLGDQQDVLDFGRHYVSHQLTSCWGDVPDPKNYTTYNARTYLQPQLNKACKRDEFRTKGDVNPKDFILFPKSAYEVVRTWKDNTGKKLYKEEMAFPTLQFPSDHGILATIIKPKA